MDQQQSDEDFLVQVEAIIYDGSPSPPFYKDVALFLKNETKTRPSLIERTLKGLQCDGIESLENLKAVTRPPDRDKFEEKLRKSGVPPAISRALYDKFVFDAKAEQQQKQQAQFSLPISEDAKLGIELMGEDYLSKKRTIVLSDATASTKYELLDMLPLTEKGALWPNRPDGVSQIDGFLWLNGNEDSDGNRKAYMKYLKDNLRLPNNYSLADVQPNRTLLTVDLLKEWSENRRIRGTTDVVISRSEHIQNGAVRNSIEVLIELKKPKNLKSRDYTAQTVCEHFAASYLNQKHAVVSSLTDLNNSWTFFWFAREAGGSDVALYTLCLREEGATGLAKYILDSLYDTTLHREALPVTFVDRVSFKEVIDSIVKNNNKRAQRHGDSPDGGAGSSLPDHDANKPSSSGWGANQHPSSARHCSTSPQGDRGDRGGDDSAMDTARTLSLFLPPHQRDVANELDLLDMVDENEQYEIVRSFAMKHIVPYMKGQY